jgi:hypothetical protein
MEKEQRQIQRFKQGMPIRLLLRHGPDGPLLAGPTSGRLTNISASGAGITVAEKIFIDNYHLFYSPRDNSEYILYLELDLSSDKEDKFISIPVRPVWLDLIQSETPNKFAMGVEFSISKKDTDLKRLIHLLQAKHQEGGNWLRNLLEKFFFDWKG